MNYRIAYKKVGKVYDILLSDLSLDELKAVVTKHFKDEQRLPENIWSRIGTCGNYRQVTIGQFFGLFAN